MMRSLKRLLSGMAVVAGLSISPALAKDFYKMSSIPAGTTVYAFQTAFVKSVQDAIGDAEIQITAAGKATRHNLEAAKFEVDFYMSSPAVYHFMSTQGAMYKDVAEAPELSKNLRNLFNYPFGTWHMVTMADSGIESLKDIKGKRVFLGEPGGSAYRVALSVVEAVSGLKAEEDFEVVKLGFGAARQAFQDRQTDLHIEPTAAPAAAFEQIALTNEIRLLGLSEEDFALEGVASQLTVPGRARGQIAANAYGSNQVNTEAVSSISTIVGLGTHKNVSDDLVYNMLKAFWADIESVHASAAWMTVVNTDNLFLSANMPLHPGAIRYYEEIGIQVPDNLRPTE